LEIKAHTKSSPATTSTAFVTEDTATGVELEFPLPFPNCPLEPSPQHRTFPFVSTAHEKLYPPAKTFDTPLVRPDTCTSTVDGFCEPSPNEPLKLLPVHFAAPLETTHECVCPTLTSVTPVTAVDGSAVNMDRVADVVDVFPTPNCPFPLLPQQRTSALDKIAHIEWEPPSTLTTPDAIEA
jgi:hypothetical protein